MNLFLMKLLVRLITIDSGGMMKQKEKQKIWQKARVFLISYLWINAITALPMQYLVEMSPLLKIYNWLIGIGAVMLFMETGFEDLSKKKNIKLSKPLTILGWVIGIVGAIICIVYYDHIGEEMIEFGGRQHVGR